ncbi:MAG: glutathione synthase [Pseudomonadota bacterium]|nr:glutathione synthase [Pseudomonadota bacterium]MDP1904003.1 glutathione synthase [Pseudomonadota bacterium]MDP2352075.1 glutathione synthase [Pseudomonadota bacterium]
MNLLFIADPLETFKTYKDSTYAMMVEAARRGHAISAMLAGDLVWKAEWVVGRTQRVVLSASAKGGGGGTSENPLMKPLPFGTQPPFGKGGSTHTTSWFERGEAEWHDLASFDAVIMRTDPPFDQAYLYATWLLEMAERQGARVFNSPRALRDYNEKLAIARYPRYIAPTLVTCHADLIREFLVEQGDIVVKPLNAMGGAMVFRLRPDDPNVGAILETITQYGRETVMAQRYLPEIKAGDKRILVIAGQPVPYCLARIPAEGETRGNLAAGGSGVAQPLSEHDWEIARALGPELHAAGLLLVGLDVIGDCLTEVNVTSPTCFQEITQQTGFNVAGMFIDALEREVRGE